MTKFKHITSEEAVAAYRASQAIFESLLAEVKNLSKKKPEATMNGSKVKMINRVLDDLLLILKAEPEGKYLERLDDDALPQMSDALLVMVQFATALHSFHSRYYRRVPELQSSYWITEEQVTAWQAEGTLEEEEEEEEEEYQGEDEE